MDKYVLYEMKKDETGHLEPSEKYNKDKKFLGDKLCIPFEQIQKSMVERISMVEESDIADLLYNVVHYACYGYSLEAFIEMGYKEYKHEKLDVEKHIKRKCEEQIKARCILSALYTVMYYYKQDSCGLLLQIAKKYSKKKYYALDEKGRKVESEFQGYIASEVQVANRFRESFDRIYDKLLEENQSKKSYFKDVIELTKEENKRRYGGFLEEFSHDLIVNNFGGGFNFDILLQNLHRNFLKTKVFRRNTKKFAKGLGLVDINFHPSVDDKTQNDTELLENILYYFKKENMFHTTLFNQAIKSSDEYIIKCFKDIIDVPVVPDVSSFLELFQNAYNEDYDLPFIISYISNVVFPVHEIVFFVSLCEYLDYDIEKMYCVLLDCLKKDEIKFIFPTQPILYEMVEREKADIIGRAILKYYKSYNIYPTIEYPFSTHVEFLNVEYSQLKYKQMLIGVEYYKNLTYDSVHDIWE